MTTTSREILLFPQRLKLAADFVNAVQNSAPHGVLLSGPNGVGKSGVGLLSYLLCAARRLPVVYVSTAGTWAGFARRGDGDEYFLQHFWRQNADLIAESPVLRGVFRAAMCDDANAFTPYVMVSLRGVMQGHHLGVGAILDEVQHITSAVAKGVAAPPSSPAEVGGTYFVENWHDWMNDNRLFVRMSIASAHGERDYRLPSGEEHRLRIVEPLTDAQRAALLSHPNSPAFLADADFRDRVVYYSGNILRVLMNATRDLPSINAALKAELTRRLRQSYDAMREDCRRWLASLTPTARRTVTELSMKLVSGTLSWIDAKGLYDAGLAYRTAESEYVLPVSAAASAAYRNTVVPAILESAKPLSSYGNGPMRGLALEQQVLARISAVTHRVASKLLDGSPAGALVLDAASLVAFRTLKDLEMQDSAVLYYPEPQTFPCDGIIMPSARADMDAIVVVECGISNPRDPARLAKLRRCLQPGGVVASLARQFPSRPVVVALMWDGKLVKRSLTAEEQASCDCEVALRTPAARVVADGTRAAVGGVPPDKVVRTAALAVRVVDRTGLEQLGVLL
jgi:hypothetical protein